MISKYNKIQGRTTCEIGRKTSECCDRKNCSLHLQIFRPGPIHSRVVQRTLSTGLPKPADGGLYYRLCSQDLKKNCVSPLRYIKNCQIDTTLRCSHRTSFNIDLHYYLICSTKTVQSFFRKLFVGFNLTKFCSIFFEIK